MKQLLSEDESIKIFKLQPLSTANGNDIGEAMSLLDANLGGGYITRQTFDGYLSGPFKAAFVAKAIGEICGVLLVEILEERQALAIMHNATYKSRTHAIEHSNVGLLKSIAVEKAFRGKQVATRLSLRGIEWLKQNAISRIIALAWDSGADANSLPLLKTLGFTRYVDLPEFWKGR